MTAFNVRDHYWVIDGDHESVWSSRRKSFVPVDDADYQSWLASGIVATVIASKVELRDVMLRQYPQGAPDNDFTVADIISACRHVDIAATESAFGDSDPTSLSDARLALALANCGLMT